VLKSQYPQRLAQYGTWTYTLNGRRPMRSAKAAGNAPSGGIGSPSGNVEGM
jgi:hypothetical protein